MRKKIVIIALILMVVLAVGGFADMYGVGAAFSLDALGGLPSSAMLSLKVPQLPIMWGVGASLVAAPSTWRLQLTGGSSSRTS